MDGFLQARLRDYDEDAPVSWYFVVNMMVPDHLDDMLGLAPTRKGEIDGVVKLFPYLGEQTEHRAHLSLLVAYHRQGVVFTKVHRIWQYEQTRWLKPILEDLAARRAAAKSESMKAACKLSATALYGMTILNTKDWRGWVLYTVEDRLESDVARLYEPGCRTG